MQHDSTKLFRSTTHAASAGYESDAPCPLVFLLRVFHRGSDERPRHVFFAIPKT